MYLDCAFLQYIKTNDNFLLCSILKHNGIKLKLYNKTYLFECNFALQFKHNQVLTKHILSESGISMQSFGLSEREFPAGTGHWMLVKIKLNKINMIKLHPSTLGYYFKLAIHPPLTFLKSYLYFELIWHFVESFWNICINLFMIIRLVTGNKCAPFQSQF